MPTLEDTMRAKIIDRVGFQQPTVRVSDAIFIAKEACRLQRESCAINARLRSTNYKGSHLEGNTYFIDDHTDLTIDVDSVRNAPEPTFPENHDTKNVPLSPIDEAVMREVCANCKWLKESQFEFNKYRQ